VAQIESGSHGVEVLAGALHEGVGRGGIDFVRGFVDDVAVQEGHGLSERHGAHDEGDQQERVDGGHDEQAQVREGPVVADADHDVEGGDAGLWGRRVSFGRGMGRGRGLRTTLRVPTNSLGGSTPVVTIIWTKLEVMPMTIIIARACRTRTRRNILLRGMAP
jgi:hypothetical protein